VNDSIDATAIATRFPELAKIGPQARSAARVLAGVPTAAKDAALRAAAAAVRASAGAILAANARDLERATAAGLEPAMIDRLTLNPARVEAVARGLEEVAALPDPIGTALAEWARPNGLRITRRRVPLGVIGIIYESRPNVTADAGALCLKSGNAVILRGGSEALESNRALHECLVEGLTSAGLPSTAIQLIPVRDRAVVGAMLAGLDGSIDVLVPRGGKSLVARVKAEARVPVIGHLEGNCHVYIDAAAEPAMAVAITLNSKLRRTGICGAAETLLIDQAAPRELAGLVVRSLLDAGCEVRGDPSIATFDARVRPATEADWSTEYLSAIISAALVDGVEGAIAHIARYGSAHTETIVTGSESTAARFLDGVDSAIVLHNASTQFADGGEFGMGAEIGISTDRFHARGPVGVEQLTSYKYEVRGSGQVRAP
jgi:glutamate-5-semialdehyde dehydrogenase